MYLPIPSQRTCAQAWLSAALAINHAGREAYNVVVDIEEPLVITNADIRIISRVDTFLRKHDSPQKHIYPLLSVANTIFPYDLYRKFGAPDFYEIYRTKVYPRIKKSYEWGRYFHRMIYHETPNGEWINPLDNLVEKIRRYVSANRTFKNVYELQIFDPLLDLSTYNPTKDAGPVMNRQCLSFLSFKLHPEQGLTLTVMYRNHYYIARGLGNFIGLGRLQQFIANEAGITVGPLTCISTHAEIDHHHWSTREVDELLQDCTEASQNSEVVNGILTSAAMP